MDPVAQVFLSDRVTNQNFANTGQFYFVPEAVDDSIGSGVGQGFQGVVNGQVLVNGVVRNFKIQVGDGYSTEGQNQVRGGTGVLAVMRQQQRLKYLGYPGKNQQPLKVDGDPGNAANDSNTRHAIRLFNATVRGNPQKRPADATNRGFNESIDLTYINSNAAPRWQAIAITPGINFVTPAVNECQALGLGTTCTNPELYGTNWLNDVLVSAGSLTVSTGGTPLPVRYASLKAGGETAIDPMVERQLAAMRTGPVFDGGMDVAIDLPTDDLLISPFFQTRLVGGVRYLAAKTNDDPLGNSHIIHTLSGTWHTNGVTSSTLRVTLPGGGTLAQLIAALNASPPLPAFAFTRDISGKIVVSPIVSADAAVPSVTLSNNVVIESTRPASFTIAFAVPDASPKTTALRITDFEEPTLRAISALIVDNPDIDGNPGTVDPYSTVSVSALMTQMERATLPTDVTIDKFLYNDPRLWDMPGSNVQFAQGSGASSPFA